MRDIIDLYKKPERRNTMLYVGGSKTSFYCECGCNVFGKIGVNQYECNSCGAWYSDATKDKQGVKI